MRLARLRRDTESAPWRSAGLIVGCVQPRGPPPAASSIYSFDSGTRFSPESLSGAETLPAPLSPSCSGNVSRRTWTPAETPACGWIPSGSSSFDRSSVPRRCHPLSVRPKSSARPRCRLLVGCPPLWAQTQSGSLCHSSTQSNTGHQWWFLDLQGKGTLKHLRKYLWIVFLNTHLLIWCRKYVHRKMTINKLGRTFSSVLCVINSTRVLRIGKSMAFWWIV